MRILTWMGVRGGVPAIASAVVALVSGVTGPSPTASASSITLRVKVTNLAPNGGTSLTPVWFGFHDGGFDLYDRDLPASGAIERIAEDGDVGPLNTLFESSGNGDVQGTIFGAGAGPGFPGAPVIAPGGMAHVDLMIDPMAASSRYFSYASMIVPSNDFFIANGNPLAFEIFDAMGQFRSNTGRRGVFEFTVLGSMVLDAGTEVNDELPENTAFFGQSMPDTGVDENGVITLADGFIPGGPILSDPRFLNADFTAPGYQIARFEITVVPEPSSVVLCGLGLVAAGGLGVRSRLRRNRLRMES
ncbi:spondin domain-containing protein [Tautonia rosea]|uniref:spondin domain-containing protein n=1 Tax=Tautonia rosea TaxID=2728037 RepID=UPI0014740C8A|nr:spondin domain-containing protein [Tautonia rosea]